MMNTKIKKPTSDNWLFHQISRKSIIKQAIIKLALFVLIPIGFSHFANQSWRVEP
jgi:hypothetical protein